MFVVTDQDYRVTLCGKLTYFAMNFFHQWAGSIDDEFQPFFFCLLPDRRRNAMRAEDQLCAGRDFIQRLNKTYTPASEVSDHMLVVNDFMEHIDRRPMPLERAFHRFNGHFHASTEPARLCQYDFCNCHIPIASLEESQNCVNPESTSANDPAKSGSGPPQLSPHPKKPKAS